MFALEMPKCHLALGLHPQVVGFENDGWDRIIHEVVTGAEATLFTTWMKVECDKLVQMCRQLGCEVQSWQNPHALPEQGGISLPPPFPLPSSQGRADAARFGVTYGKMQQSSDLNIWFGAALRHLKTRHVQACLSIVCM